jgi:hypothetical protein
LNFDKLKLFFWIEGKPMEKMNRNIPYGSTITPAVVIKVPELEVILNPVTQGREEDCQNGMIANTLKD